MIVNSINNQYNNKSFGGIKDKVPKCIVNGISDLNKTVTQSDIFKKGIEKLAPQDKSFSHIIAAESVILSSSYMIFTAKSDKIDKKQKPQMIISDALTLIFSTLGAYVLDGKMKSSFDNFVEKYFEKHKDFYTDLGKKKFQKEKSPINELMEKSGQTFGKKGDELKKGLDEISDLIGEHLKNIVGKDGKLKAFQVTKKDLTKKQEEVKNTILTSKSSKSAKEKIEKLMSNLYNSSFARVAADDVKPKYGKVRKFCVFAGVYRFIGPNISSMLTLRADKKREELEKQVA